MHTHLIAESDQQSRARVLVPLVCADDVGDRVQLQLEHALRQGRRERVVRRQHTLSPPVDEPRPPLALALGTPLGAPVVLPLLPQQLAPPLPAVARGLRLHIQVQVRLRLRSRTVAESAPVAVPGYNV